MQPCPRSVDQRQNVDRCEAVARSGGLLLDGPAINARTSSRRPRDRPEPHALPQGRKARVGAVRGQQRIRQQPAQARVTRCPGRVQPGEHLVRVAAHRVGLGNLVRRLPAMGLDQVLQRALGLAPVRTLLRGR